MANEIRGAFCLRRATWEDAAVLAVLTRELLLCERALAQTTNELNPWAASIEELEKQLLAPNTCFFVAEREHEIVGYIKAVVVGSHLHRDDIGWVRWLKALLERAARRSYTFLMRRPRPAVQIESGYIAGIFVTKEARQLGIGRALALAAENWFSKQGLKSSELHVLFNNEVARRMWEELGYEPLALGMRKKFPREE
jgi:ribosomal protein S18 acetylase RimI-like enzyme